MLNKFKNIKTSYIPKLVRLMRGRKKKEERMDRDLNYYTLYQETFEAVTWR